MKFGTPRKSLATRACVYTGTVILLHFLYHDHRDFVVRNVAVYKDLEMSLKIAFATSLQQENALNSHVHNVHDR